MELLLHSIEMDWPVLLPILLCAILTLAAAINRFSFYNKNKRDVVKFIRALKTELVNNRLDAAKNLSIQLGGVIGEVAEEAVRIFSEQHAGFSRSFDISANLATRKLEKYLTILGTVGGVCPFLGLFGTVVRILYTFQDLATQGNQSTAVAMGIGSALIATAFGLGVAIVAVVLYNLFQSTVKRYEDDFQLIKLLFLSFTDSDETVQTKALVQGKKMAFSNSDNKKTLFTEINITPLTDIFLVLLIIMMVIAPSFQSMDTDINIPEINSGVAIEQKNAEIAVTKQGAYYINGKPINADDLVLELEAIKPSLEKQEVIVKADSETKSSEIQKIMKAAQEASYSKLILAGEPLSKKEQKKLNNAEENNLETEQSQQTTMPDENWDE